MEPLGSSSSNSTQGQYQVVLSVEPDIRGGNMQISDNHNNRSTKYLQHLKKNADTAVAVRKFEEETCVNCEQALI